MIAHSGDQTSDQSKGPQGRIFRRALQLQLSNPKVVIFFASIFVSALPLASPVWFKLLVLALIFIDETLWYSILAVALSTPKAQMHFMRHKAKISALCGSLLGLTALKLLFGTLT